MRLKLLVAATLVAVAAAPTPGVAQPAQPPVLEPPARVQDYLVKPGDNFYVIGEKLCGAEHRVAVGELAFRMNPDAGVLTVDESLTVPAFCPPSSTTTTTSTTTSTSTSTTSTTQPTTSSSSTTTSTTTPPTTTSPGGTGAPFSDGFSGDLSAYSLSVFSTDRSTVHGPTNVRIEGGALVNECGAQNYGDCVLRLDRPWTGSTIAFDLRTGADHGYAEVVFTDRPYTATSFTGENANGPTPANGFAVYVRCPNADARSWVNHEQTDHALRPDGDPDIGPCDANGPNQNPGRRYEITRTRTSVAVRVDGVLVESFTSPSADGPLWISFGTHNHATSKYPPNLPTYTTRWDNLTIDEVVSTSSVGTAANNFTTAGGAACWLALNTNTAMTADSWRLTYSINGAAPTAVPFDRRHVQQEAHAFSIPVTCPPPGPNTVTIGFIDARDTSDGGGIRGGPRNVQLIATGGAPSPPTPTTTVPPATTTTAPATTTTSPTATTTTVPATTTTTTQPAVTTTTQPPSGLQFAEDFSTSAGFTSRFEAGFSVNWQFPWADPQGRCRSGAGWTCPSNLDPANQQDFEEHIETWSGDHDMTCGTPATQRTVDINSKPSLFWWCAPGNDPSRGHVMTSLHITGYGIAWIAPTAYQTSPTRVCWDMNLTDLAGGEWAQVVVAPRADVERTRGDLGYVGPGFQDPSGPSTGIIPGPNAIGVKINVGSAQIWRGSGFVSNATPTLPQFRDRATRYRHCLFEQGGNLILTQARPNGTTSMVTAPGGLPDGDVRVVLQSDVYNSDKHNEDPTHRPINSAADPSTWHWDNIEIG